MKVCTLYLKKGEATKGAGFIWEERNKTLTITDEGLELNATGESGLFVPIDTKIILNGNLKISGLGKLAIRCTGYGIYIPNGDIKIINAHAAIRVDIDLRNCTIDWANASIINGCGDGYYPPDQCLDYHCSNHHLTTCMALYYVLKNEPFQHVKNMDFPCVFGIFTICLR